MVAFCAIHILQAIARPSNSTGLSDWDLYRLAVIQELVGQLQNQAEARHQGVDTTQMSALDAMARQLSLRMRQLLSSKAISISVSPIFQSQPATFDPATSIGLRDGSIDNSLPTMSATLAPDPLRQTFSVQDEALPFISDWDLDSLFKDFTYQDVF